MLKSETIRFLATLKKNNNKEWFDKNRLRYEVAKNDFMVFVEKLLAELVRFDKAVIGLEAKKCMFRINRDVRFSKNKSPYKSNFGATMSPGGKKSNLAGYYLHVSPTEVFIAGGVWMPESDKLYAVRQEIDYNLEEFKKIVNNNNFKKHFGALSQDEKLANAPKDFPKDSPALEFLKLKSFIAYQKLNTKSVTSKTFLKECVSGYKAMYNLNLFLRRAMD